MNGADDWTVYQSKRRPRSRELFTERQTEAHIKGAVTVLGSHTKSFANSIL